MPSSSPDILPLLPLLRCPATKQPLRAATAEEKRVHGIPDHEDALASLDGTHVYGAPDGLPRLLSAKDVTAEDAG